MTKLPFCCDISNADVIFDNLCLSFRQLVVLTLSCTLPTISYFLFKTHAVNYTQNILRFFENFGISFVILGFFSGLEEFFSGVCAFYRDFGISFQDFVGNLGFFGVSLGVIFFTC